MTYFQAQAQKFKKSTPKKFLIFQEMKLSSSNSRKTLNFFSKENFSYIYKNRKVKPNSS